MSNNPAGARPSHDDAPGVRDPSGSSGPGNTASGPPVGGSDAPVAAAPLTRAVLEIDAYASELGWDRPARLFALVDTEALRRQEPGLASRLARGDNERPGSLTPVEQEELPADAALDEFLATIAWPPTVCGCALVVERLMLPADAEAELPQGADDGELTEWVAAHPSRQEVRMTVAVLRDGTRESALRLRDRDLPTEVLTGADLVPGLAEALAATFAE